ncbi:MAG: acylphosphatase, partial [Lentisphaeria bacterium]|nr:acylphosphatase [Lentisphaeria bacterium]
MAQRLTSTTRLRVYGIVQGVGFRPFVSRLAGELGLCGSVANKGSFVEIFVQGDPDLRRILAQRISADPPPRAAILKLEIKETEMPAFPDFTIAESIHDRGKIFVSPDIAVCERCLAEMRDPADRRYRHAFINCTACGPRVTILDAMPYDRVRTAMKDFPMCK